MPIALSYTLDMGSTLWNSIEQNYYAEIEKRKKVYKKNWKYYEGDHDQQLQPQKDGRDDNVILNETGNLVDKATAFLIGEGVEFKVFAAETDTGVSGQVGQSAQETGSSPTILSDGRQDSITISDDESSEEGTSLSENEQAILQFLKSNRGLIMMYNIALIGSVEGHCAIRITPADPEDSPDTRTDEQKLPKIRSIKGENFAAFWDPFDMEDVLWYRLEHLTKGEGRRIDYVKGAPVMDENGAETQDWDHKASVWYEVSYIASKAQISQTPISGKANTLQWSRVSMVEWPYPWSPIVDWQNLPNPNDYYGKNDIKVAIKLNDHINFLMSNAMRIVKHFGSPRTIGIGFTGADIESEVGGLITIPKPRGDVEVFNLEMHGDINTALGLYDVLRFSLWQSGGMIDPRAVKDTIGHLTNFALRVMFLDSEKTTDKKRLLYEEGMNKMMDRAVILMGRPDLVGRLDIVWSDVLPVDVAKAAEILLQELEQEIISMRTYRDKRGWDHFKEEARLEEEKERAGSEEDNILEMLAQSQKLAQVQPVDALQIDEDSDLNI